MIQTIVGKELMPKRDKMIQQVGPVAALLVAIVSAGRCEAAVREGNRELHSSQKRPRVAIGKKAEWAAAGPGESKSAVLLDFEGLALCLRNLLPHSLPLNTCADSCTASMTAGRP